MRELLGLIDVVPPDDVPCRKDPEMWFPEKGGNTSGPEAKHRCLTMCGWRAECLTLALSFPDHPKGIWAGMSQVDRSKLAKKRWMYSA